MQRTLNSAQKTTQLLVRINGTLPNISILGDEQKSERAAEIKRNKIIANTSCSVFSTDSVSDSRNENIHLLIEVGEGVAESLEKSGTDVTSQSNGLVLNFE
jgi:hypothetical protein